MFLPSMKRKSFQRLLLLVAGRVKLGLSLKVDPQFRIFCVEKIAKSVRKPLGTKTGGLDTQHVSNVQNTCYIPINWLSSRDPYYNGLL